MIVVGGGATGAGVAIDGATRGYDVLLLEQSDFGKGTSSRSTKLVHGGVRYLEQGNVSLVMEALKERGLLLQNAPHLVRNLGFIVPNYDWWEAPFYGIGLKLYNLLAGKYGFGASRILSKEETLERLPTINTEGLRGGVIYFDGQFDDSRLLINLVTTAYEQGAVLLNYAQAADVTRDGEGFVDGVVVRDMETGEEFHAQAKVVVNATGPFCDDLRRKADPAVEPMIAASQGIHLVFDGSFLSGDSAIMVPHTSDGRVMFAIPGTATRWSAPPTPLFQRPRWSPSPSIRRLNSSSARRRFISLKSRPAPMSSASSRAFARWCARAIPAIPRPSRAITPSASKTAVWLRSAAASGPPIATWRKIASTRPPRWRACRRSRVSPAISTCTASTPVPTSSAT